MFLNFRKSPHAEEADVEMIITRGNRKQKSAQVRDFCDKNSDTGIGKWWCTLKVKTIFHF